MSIHYLLLSVSLFLMFTLTKVYVDRVLMSRKDMYEPLGYKTRASYSYTPSIFTISPLFMDIIFHVYIILLSFIHGERHRGELRVRINNRDHMVKVKRVTP